MNWIPLYSVFFMLREDIHKLRQNYKRSSLEEGSACQNAIEQFDKWFAEAAAAKIYEYNAMTLATCSKNRPDARIVLLKSFSEEGFVFFTNYNSTKGKDLEDNPQAAMVFLWKDLERQVRIRGIVKKVERSVTEKYFLSRPKESQCGAIASAQSKEISSRDELEKQYQDILNNYKESEKVVPKHWGGYILQADEIEFWQGREGRMHDRLLYKKNKATWAIVRLQP